MQTNVANLSKKPRRYSPHFVFCIMFKNIYMNIRVFRAIRALVVCQGGNGKHGLVSKQFVKVYTRIFAPT